MMLFLEICLGGCKILSSLPLHNSMLPTEQQRVTHISHCLQRLIPVGTITFYGVLTETCGFQAVRVPRSTYKWVDSSYVLWHFPQEELHPLLRTLLDLLERRYLQATYKIVSRASDPKSSLWKVRVYAIPLDMDGARYLRQWRRDQGKALTAREFGTMWTDLLSVLDFSSSSWLYPSPITQDNARGLCLVPFLKKARTKFSPPFSFDTSYHMRRWLTGESFSLPILSREEPDAIVERIYSSIALPDVSQYSKQYQKLNEDGIAVAEELISITLKAYHNRQAPVNGIQTELYPFQIRSLCKMYEKETVVKKDIVPNFLEVTSPMRKIYYYDSILPGLYSQPELYFLPRGGILAENMGFGKTLICLSLVCLTNHEVSVTLGDMLPCRGQKRGPIASLTKICVDAITQNSLPWKYYQDVLTPNLIKRIRDLPAVFEFFNNNASTSLKSRKRSIQESEPEIVYLCSTTLIVVPDNLFHQWNDEIRKHLKAGTLKILYISGRFRKSIQLSDSLYTDTLLPIKELISYDLVIITAQQFIKCNKTSTSMERIYWKRLIVDEGHCMSSRSSTFSSNCNSLLAERRWAVTGTPTFGLTSLHMDKGLELVGDVDENQKQHASVVKGKYDIRKDLIKLGTLVSQFFKIEPFYTQIRLWNSVIVKGIFGLTSYTSEKSLSHLLNSLMIRHAQAEVQRDLRLPKLHHELVTLEPSYQNKLAMNLFNAVLAVNAVTSERVGQDYMLSSNNRAKLRHLIRNLQFASFYWTGFKIEDVKNLMQVAEENLKKVDENGHSKFCPRDLNLLQLSLTAAKQAINNPRWRMASIHHDMQYFVENVPSLVGNYFALGAMDEIHIYTASQLHALQRFYYKNRFLDFDNKILLDNKLRVAAREFWAQNRAIMDGKRHTKLAEQELIDTRLGSSVASDRIEIHNFKPSFQEKGGEKNDCENEVFKGFSSCSDPCKFKDALILGTASAKLSYLCCKLVSHAKNGIKSIVFFDNEDNAYYLIELLEVLGVPYILYANFVGVEQRANNLKDFASHDAAQSGATLIMDLNLAAHGLTIISATHVYFICPVWQRSVEAQAIKRAHRIGQKSKVHVETLVLRGTLEEEMYRIRSRELDTRADAQTSSDSNVIENNEIQQYIMNYSFIPITEREEEYATFVLPCKLGASTKGGTPDEHTLQDHYFEVDTQTKLEIWHAKLFNPGNLRRFEESGREKASTQRLNMELVTPKESLISSPKKVKNCRKRVRF